MAAPPPPGWYPDPTGKPGQMYWDGEAWHRLTPDIPATPKADIPGTPKPTQPPVTTRGPSGQRKVGFVLARLALLVIAVQVVVYLVLRPSPLAVLVSVAIVIIGVIIGVTIAVRSGQSGARTGTFVIAMVLGLFAVPWVVRQSQSPVPPGPVTVPSNQPGNNSGSSYYQEGYNSGTSGLARKGYGDDEYNTGATVAEMEHNACSRAINNEPNLVSIEDSDHPANQDDYMNGCLKAFGDHPPTGKPKPGPLNPYR
jgi:Protein of unknown function (DUF2510)